MRNLQAFGLVPAQFILGALQHFLGGVVGVSQREDFIRAGMPLAHQMRNPADEDSRLSSTRTRDHKHRPGDVLDGLLLLCVRLDGVDLDLETAIEQENIRTIRTKR